MVRREPRWKLIDWWSLGIASAVLFLTFVLRLGSSAEPGTTVISAVLGYLQLLF
jgi:hypothetical protein